MLEAAIDDNKDRKIDDFVVVAFVVERGFRVSPHQTCVQRSRCEIFGEEKQRDELGGGR